MSCSGSCGGCKKNERTALITGASSGIGHDLAKIHAANGGDLILVARREDKLQALKFDLEKRFSVSVHIIIQDLSLPNASEELFAKVKEGGFTVDYLINNAGFGLYGKYWETSWEKNKQMINLNVMTLAGLTHMFLQEMVERGEGRILNVSSVAAFMPGPLQPTYFATKAYILSLSEALTNELAGTNVTVSTLCPGTTKTEFFSVARLEETHFAHIKGMSSFVVAKAGYDGMIRGDTLIIPGFINKAIVQSLRFVPRFLARKITRYLMEK